MGEGRVKGGVLEGVPPGAASGMARGPSGASTVICGLEVLLRVGRDRGAKL